MGYRWIPISEPDVWDDSVREAGGGDLYHTAAYHAVSAALDERYVGGGGEPFLFVYEDSGGRSANEAVRIAVPLLRHRVDTVAGLEKFAGRYDATSAYGYPGLLARCDGDSGSSRSGNAVDPGGNAVDPGAVLRFQAAFAAGLRELGIVSFFGRSNPLCQKERFWYDGLADVRRTGWTVAVDLTLLESEQWRRQRRDTRARLRQARDAGVTVRESTPYCGVGVGETLRDGDIDGFMRLYDATMRSVGAASGYFFPRSYYENLSRWLGVERVRFVFAELGGEPIAAAIFLVSDGNVSGQGGPIVQYHLSGSVDDERTRRFGGGTRSILDFMRHRGCEIGAAWLHLGGGVGGRGPGDPLFDFKAGFSPVTFEFDTVRFIVDPDRYTQLTAAHGGESGDFFPNYRRSGN